MDGIDTGIWTVAESGWVGCTSWPARLALLTFFPIFFFLRPFFMAVWKKPGGQSSFNYLNIISLIDLIGSLRLLLLHNTAACCLAGWLRQLR